LLVELLAGHGLLPARFRQERNCGRVPPAVLDGVIDRYIAQAARV